MHNDDATAKPAAPKFVPIEIAYRIPGTGWSWRRTVAKTRAAFDRKIASLVERGAEIQTRTWEG